MTEWIRLVQQPGCCNVVRYTGDKKGNCTGGTVRRVYQDHRTRCEGFIAGYISGSDAIHSYAVQEARPVICGPGNCLTMAWIDRDPPQTWGRDCKEWQ
jgi:hypothetical protein